MKKLKIHFLNTVWSDSIILESEGHFALIDAASKFYYPMVKEYIDKLKIKKFDFILLTHFHSDHYGNMVNVMTDYDFEKFYTKTYVGLEGYSGDGYPSKDDYIAHERAIYNDIIDIASKKGEIVLLDKLGIDELTIQLNGIDIEIYDLQNHLYNVYNDETSPCYHQNKFSENGNSVGICIYHNNHSVYLGADTGDSNTDIPDFHKQSTRNVSSFYNKHNINHIDIYKSCHHGGGDTNNSDLCKLMNMDYCIITNSPRWLDKWPTYGYIKEGNKKAKILTTDYHQYVFDLSGKRIKLKKIKKESLFITLKKN